MGREERRYARLPCFLVVGDSEVAGFTQNISAHGMAIQVPRDLGERVQVGMALQVRCMLPDGRDPADGVTEVVWVDASAVDTAGAPVASLGLDVADADSVLAVALGGFVTAFRYTVLAVDDEPANLDLLRRALASEYRVVCVGRGGEALAHLEQAEAAVLITDQRMPDMSGLELCKRIVTKLPHSHVSKIVLTGYAEAEEIQEFINAGKIFHHIMKPLKVVELLPAVRRGVEAYALAAESDRLLGELARSNEALRRENLELRRQAAQGGIDRVVGSSAALRKVLEVVKQVAPTDATVLIHGETGTGKELMALTLHTLSPRRDLPFVAVNCAALPETLIESELFGHERGAFTGATARRAGRFERAHGGTLFIDEVGDLPLAVQVKLLRVLQDGAITRVGSNTPVQTDVRVVAATHADLDRLIEEGKFREDLFYRLNVVPIEVPPLRERPEDIWPLVVHYLNDTQQRVGKQGVRISARLRRALEKYDWPGNVRELINVVDRIVALTDSDKAADAVEFQRRPARRSTREVTAAGPSLKEMMSGVERQFIREALQRNASNRTRAARELGLSRQALSIKLGKHKLR